MASWQQRLLLSSGSTVHLDRDSGGYQQRMPRKRLKKRREMQSLKSLESPGIGGDRKEIASRACGRHGQ